MSEKRKRGQNFAPEEKEKLLKLLRLYKDNILNKKTDGAANEAKAIAWSKVTYYFNVCGNVYRTKDSLLKLWEKLKTDSKQYYQSTRTDGGSSNVKRDPILERVCAILGVIDDLPDHDSDVTLTELINCSDPKMFCEDKQSEIEHVEDVTDCRESPPLQYLRLEMTGNTGNEEKTEENDSSNETKQCSRKRPHLPEMNERTEAMASLCSSFKNVNKKKEDIEDLRRRLLEQELEFKSKLYELQLGAAAKDIEIKTKEIEIKAEILNQIKGGLIDLSRLLGTCNNNRS